jgi:hypothetical protein
MRRQGGAALAALLLALTGCGTDHAGRAPSTLAAKVSPKLGGGAAVVQSATGPMDLDLAASATAVPSSILRPFLRSHGYQYGYSRVWQRDSELVTALGLHFFADRDADAFVAFSDDRIATSAYYVGFTDAGLPGSRGFELTSRVRGATRFCAGEYFAVSRDAYVVTRCADFPVPSQSVTQLAQQQLMHVLTGGNL